MLLRIIPFAIALALTGCTTGGDGDDTPGTPDAPPLVDAGAGQFGASCTTVSLTSTECDSMVCTDSFDQLPTPVCSVQCTQADPSVCPIGSMGQKCNMEGFCRP
jgi:hypothetical protein